MQDLRYAIRLLRRQPGFAAVAILTFALGIGATTILFSVVYGVLMRPLPWPEADRLVRLTETRQGRTGRVAGTLFNGTYVAWRDHPSTLEDLGGWLTQTSTLTGAGDPLRVPIISTTPSLFPILRARPLIGRLFRDGEGTRGRPDLIILSYGLWQERFGGRAEVVGHLVRLDDKPFTIVGVMPRDFAFPDRETRAWTAWSVPPVDGEGGAKVGVIFRAIARLRPGATPAQAAAEGTSRARAAAADWGFVGRALFGAAGPVDISVVPELQAITADVRPAILVLLAAVALLLITATANVASLQLARATTRRREMAVRAAIGAGQLRIVRQLLIENAIVGLLGGAAGLALAWALQRVLPSLLPAGFPRLDAVAIDARAFLFALVVSVVASVACGLLPAWHTRRVNLVEALAEDGVGQIGGARTPMARTRALIMAGQVAIACVLLVGAALLTHSFLSLIRADRGYDPVNVLTARLPLPADVPAERRGQLLDTLIERLRSVPGVTHAAYSTALPFVSAGGFIAFSSRSPRNPDVEMDVQAAQRVVSPDYFAAMRLHLVAGRGLSDADAPSAPPAVVVNRSFAKQYLGDHPVGMRIPLRGPRAGARFVNDKADWDIVGVVDDMRQDSVDAPPLPEVFVSFKQVASSGMRNFDPILVVRTASDPTAFVSTLRGLVHEEAPGLALDSVMTMEDRVMTSLARPRLYAVVLVGFGVFALLVASVGLFGVLSYGVAQRRREIGVRSALGARTRDIVVLVLHQALWIVGIGVAVGLAAAMAGVKLLAAFLYGVSPYDALTFVAVPLVIAAVAGVACVVPARRAARVDPLTALRAE